MDEENIKQQIKAKKRKNIIIAILIITVCTIVLFFVLRNNNSILGASSKRDPRFDGIMRGFDTSNPDEICERSKSRPEEMKDRPEISDRTPSEEQLARMDNMFELIENICSDDKVTEEEIKKLEEMRENFIPR